MKAAATLTVADVGTRRRLQALACEGWSTLAIAELLQVDHRAVQHLRAGVTGRSRVTRVTAARVDAVYRLLLDRECRSPRAGRVRGDAARAGWVPRAAWSAATIDDPAAGPWGSAAARGEWDRLTALGVSARAAAVLAERAATGQTDRGAVAA